MVSPFFLCTFVVEIKNKLLRLMIRRLWMMVCCCVAVVCVVAQPRYQKDRMQLERLNRGVVVQADKNADVPSIFSTSAQKFSATF